MAGRTSASVGVAVTIAILGILSLTLFILTMVFLSQKQAAERSLVQANADLKDFVTPDERQRDDMRLIADAARRERQSVVAYLQGSLGTAMERVTGSRRDGVAQLTDKFKGFAGAESASILQVLRDREARVAALEKSLAEAEQARTTALADLQNEVERVRAMETSQRDTLAQLNQQIDAYKEELDLYRGGIEGWRAQMDANVDKVRQESNEEKAKLQGELTKLQDENLVLKNQVAKMREERTADLLKPGDEFALVDGTVVGTDPNTNQAFISLGRKDKVMVGMTFTVYPAGTPIRPDANGEYPRGKAVLEIVSVGDTNSTARIISEARGNPVVRGDFLANAVYDPKKVYKFVVYGNFDINNDGRATPQEATDVEGIVRAWGGQVVPELEGDVDFLVLGRRPVLPLVPGPNDPIEVFDEYVRLQRVVQRYDDLLRAAQSTSLPVLNENRLKTLTGIGER